MPESTILSVETIHWRSASSDPPSDDTTVMISIHGGSEPVWLGYLDDGEWRHLFELVYLKLGHHCGRRRDISWFVH